MRCLAFVIIPCSCVQYLLCMDELSTMFLGNNVIRQTLSNGSPYSTFQGNAPSDCSDDQEEVVDIFPHDDWPGGWKEGLRDPFGKQVLDYLEPTSLSNLSRTSKSFRQLVAKYLMAQERNLKSAYVYEELTINNPSKLGNCLSLVLFTALPISFLFRLFPSARIFWPFNPLHLDFVDEKCVISMICHFNLRSFPIAPEHIQLLFPTAQDHERALILQFLSSERFPRKDVTIPIFCQNLLQLQEDVLSRVIDAFRISLLMFMLLVGSLPLIQVQAGFPGNAIFVSLSAIILLLRELYIFRSYCSMPKPHISFLSAYGTNMLYLAVLGALAATASWYLMTHISVEVVPLVLEMEPLEGGLLVLLVFLYMLGHLSIWWVLPFVCLIYFWNGISAKHILFQRLINSYIFAIMGYHVMIAVQMVFIGLMHPRAWYGRTTKR